MKKSTQWTVYLLRCSDGSLYTGITTDPERRLEMHQQGKASKYTRARRPVEMVWQESGHSESSAKRREAEIKKISRATKLRFLKKAH